MKTSGLLALGVLLTLLCPPGPAHSDDNDAAETRPPSAVKERAEQEAELLRQLLALKQGQENRVIVTRWPYGGHRVGAYRFGPAVDYKIRIVRPDPKVDYKIVHVRPDPNVDYKIRSVYPGGQPIYVVPRAHRPRTITIDPRPGGGDK